MANVMVAVLVCAALLMVGLGACSKHERVDVSKFPHFVGKMFKERIADRI